MGIIIFLKLFLKMKFAYILLIALLLATTKAQDSDVCIEDNCSSESEACSADLDCAFGALAWVLCLGEDCLDETTTAGMETCSDTCADAISGDAWDAYYACASDCMFSSGSLLKVGILSAFVAFLL